MYFRLELSSPMSGVDKQARLQGLLHHFKMIPTFRKNKATNDSDARSVDRSAATDEEMSLSITDMRGPRSEDRVSAAIARDRRAFDELVSEYSGPLRQFIERRVPAARVDDLLQDVWVAAWTALPNFDRRSRFQTWLCAIGLNKVRDLYRRESRLVLEVSLQENALNLESPDLPSSFEARDEVRSLVARLPEKQREVIEMYYCCEYTLPEVAQALGRNINTVKYQFYTAHSELAAMMKKEGRR